MYKIIRKVELAENIDEFEVEAPRIANKAQAGQFVILRLDEEGERFPLTIADYNRDTGTITVVVLKVGFSTKKLGALNVGDSISDVVGPLGHATEIPKNKKIVVIGGGLGIAPVYPIARTLQGAGNEVTAIIGAKNQKLLFWEDKLSSVCSGITIATDDGSKGHKGFVTDVLQNILGSQKIDRVIAIGPGVMMRAISKVVPENIELIVSLNSLMVDGTGMCGGCRVTVGGEVKFTCVDGPEFDGHKVDYDEFLNRQKTYKKEEDHICRVGLTPLRHLPDAAEQRPA